MTAQEGQQSDGVTAQEGQQSDGVTTVHPATKYLISAICFGQRFGDVPFRRVTTLDLWKVNRIRAVQARL